MKDGDGMWLKKIGGLGGEMDGGTAPFWPKSVLASKKLLHSSHITTISSRLELP